MNQKLDGQFGSYLSAEAAVELCPIFYKFV